MPDKEAQAWPGAVPPGGQFRLLIQASRTLGGCQDAQATVRLVDPDLLEGQFGDGRTLTLKRK